MNEKKLIDVWKWNEGQRKWMSSWMSIKCLSPEIFKRIVRLLPLRRVTILSEWNNERDVCLDTNKHNANDFQNMFSNHSDVAVSIVNLFSTFFLSSVAKNVCECVYVFHRFNVTLCHFLLTSVLAQKYYE